MIDALQPHLPKVKEFSNGKPSFTDIETQSPTVAVFISNVTPTGYLDGTLHATLHVAAFMRSASREDDLDKLAQEIYESGIVEESLVSLTETTAFSSFDYEQDEQMATWIAADIQYNITYEVNNG
ncbi:phage minor tail protein U [Haemophilus paraphrohaemolyticus HK411]|uniref:Phage minor tail protein U n=1 Tax=Haemophilus paraphrohaemolyticus HK411 TaxID=1095743 RepID=I2NPU0_9PAST|nr:phage minor tail protein U [Haemophilus paraphrohaemolyticus HK411]